MKQTAFITYILLAMLLLTACKKVENDLKQQFDQPSVSSTSITLPDGTSIVYPKNVRPGDTLAIAGRLNTDKGAEIWLGAEKVKIVGKGTMDYTYYLTGTHFTFEFVKFVVTPGMGSGPQPLVVTYGPYRYQAPDINIMVPGTGGSQPDTTLVVTEIFDGNLPDFANRYNTYNQSPYFQQSLHVTNDGTVYFGSEWDIYRVKDGLAEWLLKKEDGIRVDGQLTNITKILGMAPDPEGHQLYISFRTSVTAPDNYSAVNYLVRKDLGTGEITVLNKTALETFPGGNTPTGKTRPANVAFRGPVGQMPVSATMLKVDAKGRLIYLNSDNTSSYAYYGRLDGGDNITPLMELDRSTGNLFKYQKVLGITPDGSAAFIVHEEKASNPRSTGVSVLDLETQEPVYYMDAGVNVNFESFDPDPARRMQIQTGFFQAASSVFPNMYLPVARNEVLYVSNYSIASLNPELANIYIYAGLEIGGYKTQNGGTRLPEQNQSTGPALYVDYSPNQIRFIGQDASGKIYFMRGGLRQVNPQTYLPPRIYTLGKPQDGRQF